MTEHLAGLLLRLCEAGEPSILWGRLAKPFLGREFDRLLSRGVLVEEAPAEEWDVCSDCECGQDSRIIQTIDGKLIAACPIDHHSDVVLEAEDLRSFRIDPVALVREIAGTPNLNGNPAPVLPGVWHLGVGPAKRALFVVLARRDLVAPGLIAALQRVDKLSITIVGPAVPPAERLRFADASIHYVSIIEALRVEDGGFLLEERQLMPHTLIAPRLTVYVQESRIVLDGKNLELSDQNFKLMSLLAEEVSMGRVLVSHEAIAAKIWPGKKHAANTAEFVRNLRNALKPIIDKKPKALPLIQAVPKTGYRLALDAAEVMIVR